jgi:prefoldin subunit 5
MLLPVGGGSAVAQSERETEDLKAQLAILEREIKGLNEDNKRLEELLKG